MKSVYYWSPFLTHVATISAVIESAKSLKKYSRKYDPVIIDACGEFERYKKTLIQNQIKIINLTSIKYFKFLPKNGFISSRFSYILIFLFSLIPLYKVIKKKKTRLFYMSFDNITSDAIGKIIQLSLKVYIKNIRSSKI